jgi:hypothetical protein
VLDAADALNEDLKLKIECVSRRYERYFSPIPGLCSSFEYKFFLKEQPKAMREQPIPSTLREQVRQPINMMSQQDIIQPSNSPSVLCSVFDNEALITLPTHQRVNNASTTCE